MLSKNKINFSASKISRTQLNRSRRWLQRQAINNSTFKDEQEISRAAVTKWKDVYNKNHCRANTNILQENVSSCLHIC